jgi:hypothetical protein
MSFLPPNNHHLLLLLLLLAVLYLVFIPSSFFSSDLIAAGCQFFFHFLFNLKCSMLSNSVPFFFIAIKTYKLSVCSLFSLVLLVTQKKKNARDRPVNSYLYVVKSHDFVNVNKNVQKKKLSVVYKQEFNECSLKEKENVYCTYLL